MSKHIPPSNSKQFKKKKKKKSAVVGVTGKRRIFSGKLISLITKIQNNKNNLQGLVALPFLKPNLPPPSLVLLSSSDSKKPILDPLHIIVVGEPRTEEPNLRIYLFNSSKERQMNYKDYAHLRRIKDLVGSWHPKKTKIFRPRPFIEM